MSENDKERISIDCLDIVKLVIVSRIVISFAGTVVSCLLWEHPYSRRVDTVPEVQVRYPVRIEFIGKKDLSDFHPVL
jgi:hypothetical protein